MAPRLAVTFLIVLLWLNPTTVEAERLPTRVFTTADGLANNLVTRIVPDSRGYLWFCTAEGLSRFDGHGFTTYGIDDGLPSGTVNDVLETRDGTYWIATSRGLVRFDPLGTPGPTPAAHSMFSTFKPAADSMTHDVMSLFQDRAGTVWVGTALGLYQLQPGDRAPIFTRPSNLESYGVLAMAEDLKGGLWIGTGNGVYRRTANGSVEHYGIPEGLPANDVQTILADRHGGIWIGTRSSGLALLTVDPRSQQVAKVRVYSMGDGLPSNWINQLFEGRDGALWAATSFGLVQILPAADPGRYRFRTLGPASLGFEHPGMMSMAEDGHGNAWVGSGTGVAKILSEGFTVFGAREGIRSAATLFQPPAGGVVAMEGSGWRFFQFAGEKFVVTDPPLSYATPSWGWNQMVLIDRGGDWWIGTRTGVLRFAGVQRLEQLARSAPIARYTRRDGLAADVVIRLFEDSRGDVWIATVGEGLVSGLSRWQRTTGTCHHYTGTDGLPRFDRFYVSSMAEDGAGNVWIGFNDEGGLVRYRAGRFERFGTQDGIPPGSIRNLVVDRRNRVWGASYGGLLRVDGPDQERPAFSRYTTAQGLSSNRVTAVVEDRLGRIYAGTARGIDRLDPLTGRIRSHRSGEGLPSGEMLAAIRDRDGVLWASYTTGLVRIVAADDAPPEAFPVVMTGVHVAGQKQPISAVGQPELAYLELPWNRNSLEVTFVSPGSGPSDDLRYQIRLDGGDSEWSSPSDQRTVVYANLAPGRYRFQVRALNSDGVVSGATAGFSFTILPPLWQRWWFRTLAGLLIAAVAYAFYRYRVSRLLEVAEMRNRIATDLHDDIGANLTRIAVLSEVVRRQRSADGDAQLASIAAVARESVTAMSDIVWAISPGRDGLNDLTRKMREHAEEVFAIGETSLTFTAPDGPRDIRLSVDMRRDIYLIFKEAINNAARHADCSHVQVEIQSHGAQLVLSVSDDGNGFDTTVEGDGNGLVSMRRRAERLGATFDVRSRPGDGTDVRLEVPQHRVH